jgi:multiple sugar transport system ATP-binding protein
MATVSLHNVSRQFEKVTAIEDITFEVPDGEFWVLVGPSGCGKSTLLRTIAGLEQISTGTLYIGGQLMNQVPARDRDVAMVFQNYALYPHMSVADNLAFGLRMRNVDEATITERVQQVARSLDISHLLERKPRQLSGGQQQRVALGRAIARKPKVFLLDEPLSNLDAQLRDETRAELKKLHQQVGITTIYVTHDQTEAMTLADQIVVLERGRIQQMGCPQEVYARPANRMVATFIGNPPMNLLPAVYTQDQFTLPQTEIPCPPRLQQQLALTEAQEINLGIRPEHINLSLSTSTPNSLAVKVDVVEPLGREILVRASLPETNITLDFYANATWQGKRGDKVELQLDLDSLFVFDAKTGVTLYPTLYSSK